jgi:hypothetical protein
MAGVRNEKLPKTIDKLPLQKPLQRSTTKPMRMPAPLR